MAANKNPRITFQKVGKAVSWTQSKNSTSYGKKKWKLRQQSLDLAQMTEMKALSENIKLHEIARRGDLELLRAHIEGIGLSVKARDDNRGTLLHAAAATNQVNILSYLLDCSSSIIDAVDGDGNTALHVATINGHIESMHLLLDKGASDTILNKKQDASLHTAIKSGNVEYVRGFLQHTNIDLLVQGYRKRTPLHVAAEMNLVSMVQEIKASILVVREWKEKMSFRLCAPDADNLTPIHLAARHGSADVLDYMIDNCVNHGYTIDSVLKFLDEENSTPMHAAVDAGHIDVVRVLLKYGASPVVCNGDNSNIPPLHLACYQGRLEMVQAMVEHCGTDILHTYTAQGQSPLHWAARSIRGGQIVRYLLQKGVDVMHRDLEGNTALHSAIIFGSLEAAIELLKACRNEVSVLNNIQQNALHQAVLYNRKAILLELLKMPNIRDMMFQKDTNGMSALHYALNSGQDDLISCLLNVASTCLPNLKDETGSNYLHLAAKSGNWKAMNCILMTPTGLHMLNEVNASGGTPLHIAAITGHLSCVRLLLSNGAMIHKCHYGYTPFLSAVYYKHVECAQALYEAHPFQQEWTDDEGNTALHMAVSGSGDHHCPEILKLCLNLGIPVTHNNKGETFLDIVIDTNNLPAALAVVQHPRWQECLDFPVMGDRKHPFLRFIESMPDVAEEILSKCIEKSKLSPKHPDYFQRYDFKYLCLLPEDVQDICEDDVPGEDEKKSMPSEARLLSSVMIKYKRVEEDNEVSNKRKQNHSEGMEALQTMLKGCRIDLLTHPVVAYYLKSKWKTYGGLIYGLQFLLFFLQVVFLSAFILVTPPTHLNITDDYMVIDGNTTSAPLQQFSDLSRWPSA